MSFLSPHKFWIATLGFAIVLIIASAPMLGFLRDEAAQHLAKIQGDREKMQQALQRLDDDIATTQALSGQIGADEVEKSLAYVDRLKAADVLEQQATATRLDHFTYTLSPEQKITISNPGAAPQELATSTITVKADAPLDIDAYAFAEHVRGLLPGRLRLQSITLERMGPDSAPPAANNLRMTANFEWLSNGVTKQMAEGR